MNLFLKIQIEPFVRLSTRHEQLGAELRHRLRDHRRLRPHLHPRPQQRTSGTIAIFTHLDGIEHDAIKSDITFFQREYFR